MRPIVRKSLLYSVFIGVDLTSKRKKKSDNVSADRRQEIVVKGYDN